MPWRPLPHRGLPSGERRHFRGFTGKLGLLGSFALLINRVDNFQKKTGGHDVGVFSRNRDAGTNRDRHAHTSREARVSQGRGVAIRRCRTESNSFPRPTFRRSVARRLIAAAGAASLLRITETRARVRPESAVLSAPPRLVYRPFPGSARASEDLNLTLGSRIPAFMTILRNRNPDAHRNSFGHPQPGRTHKTRCEMLIAEGVKALIHCGDLTSSEVVEECSALPCYYVFGNNDFDEADLSRSMALYGGICLGKRAKSPWPQSGGSRSPTAIRHGSFAGLPDWAPLPDVRPHACPNGRTTWVNPVHQSRRTPSRSRWTVARLDLASDELLHLDVSDHQ